MSNPNRPTPPPIPGNMQNRQTPPPLRQASSEDTLIMGPQQSAEDTLCLGAPQKPMAQNAMPQSPVPPMPQNAAGRPAGPARPVRQKSGNGGARAAAAIVAGIAGFGAAAAAAAYLDKDGVDHTVHTNVPGVRDDHDDIHDNHGGDGYETKSVDNSDHTFTLSSQEGVPTYEGSFAEAFAEARHDLGPGGVFEWNGKMYGTYTIDEWNSMSAGEREQYWAHASGLQGSDYEPQYAISGNAEPTVDPDTGYTFGEAFSEARSMVGSGSVFEWNGRYYGTFTKDEWAAMSPAERNDWYHNADNQISGGMAYHPGTDDVGEPFHPSDHEYAYNYDEAQGANQGAEADKDEYITDETDETDVAGDNDELRILNAGTVNVEGQDVSVVAIGTGSDDMAVFVDVDNDGVLDLMVMDDNGDGVISENEYSYIQHYNLTTNDLESVVNGGSTQPSNDVVEEPVSGEHDEVYIDEHVNVPIDAIDDTHEVIGIAENTIEPEIDVDIDSDYVSTDFDNELAVVDDTDLHIDDYQEPTFDEPSYSELAYDDNDVNHNLDFDFEMSDDLGDDQSYMAYDDMSHDGFDSMDDFNHFDDGMLS